MTADAAPTKPRRPASGRAAGSVTPAGEPAAARGVGRGAATAAGAPFYDHLMSMIEETAVENRRVQQHRPADASPHAATHQWRVGPMVGPMLTWTVGLIVVAAFGTAIIGAAARLREPSVAAGGAPDKRPPPVASAGMAEMPVARSVARLEPAAPAPEPAAPPPVGAEVGEVKAVIIETGSVSPAPPVVRPEMQADIKLEARREVEPEPKSEPKSEARAESKAEVAKPEVKVKLVAVLPIVPAPQAGDHKSAGTPPAAPPSAREATIAAEDPPAQPPAPEVQFSAATVSQVEAPIDRSAAARMARMVSDANVRAGPGSTQPVVGTIRRGTAVEVISCRTWCEVSSGDKRGWVYKDYVGAPEAFGAR